MLASILDAGEAQGNVVISFPAIGDMPSTRHYSEHMSLEPVVLAYESS